MIQSHWKRIAGIRCEDDGDIACVWLALDPDTDLVHLYDCCVFRREVLAVVAEGLNARGRWIPVAWENKDMADKLLERGCNMLPDPVKDTEQLAEMTSRDIWERMRSGRFKVDKRLAEWLDEYKSFGRKDNQIPKAGYPLMTATRLAVAELKSARKQAIRGKSRKTAPKLAIV